MSNPKSPYRIHRVYLDLRFQLPGTTFGNTQFFNLCMCLERAIGRDRVEVLPIENGEGGVRIHALHGSPAEVWAASWAAKLNDFPGIRASYTVLPLRESEVLSYPPQADDLGEV